MEAPEDVGRSELSWLVSRGTMSCNTSLLPTLSKGLWGRNPPHSALPPGLKQQM